MVDPGRAGDAHARKPATRSTSRTSSTSSTSTPSTSSSRTISSPGRAAERPYRLLIEAMTDLQKVAVGQYRAARQGAPRRHPSARRHAVHRDHAARRRGHPPESIEEIPRGDDIAPSQKELDMARQLIEALVGRLRARQVPPTPYREQLLEIIEKKAAGEEIVAEPTGRGAGQGRRPHGRARGEPGHAGKGGERGPGPRRGRRRRRRRPRRPAPRKPRRRRRPARARASPHRPTTKPAAAAGARGGAEAR